ncbi:MAG: type II toxin-antitoxin system VapC family toxin [Anaerolineales bacterium]
MKRARKVRELTAHYCKITADEIEKLINEGRMIVADTNLIVYLFITGDQTPLAQKRFLTRNARTGSFLHCKQFRNVIAGYIRRGMNIADNEIMKDAMLTLENRQVTPSSEKILILISKSDCTAYDCEFIALAQQLNIVLVTADKQLQITVSRFSHIIGRIYEVTKISRQRGEKLSFGIHFFQTEKHFLLCPRNCTSIRA